MKYMVMECHKAYAILMDEASRVVHAANLHYEVGQIVESPVLLQDTQSHAPRITRTLRRCIAAAACIAVTVGAGALYYQGNFTPYSSIMVCAQANMRMEVSRSGKVLSVQPLNQNAADMLTDYEYSGKDQLTVTNELIGRAVESGYVRQGDTVGVYYQKEKNKDAAQFQENVEKSLATHHLNPDIHDNFDQAEPPAPPAATEPAEESAAPPVPPHEKEQEAPLTPHKEEPAADPALPTPGKETPPAPGQKPEKPDVHLTPGQRPAVDSAAPSPADPAAEPAEISPAEPVAPPQDTPPEPDLPAEEHSLPKHERPQHTPVPPAPPESEAFAGEPS